MWGKPVAVDSFKLNVRTARMGAVDFELIQPTGGKSLWKDFLETHGEGVHHLGFFVDDIEKETAKLEKKGLKVMYRSWRKDGGGATYFDTGKVGGVLTEIIQRS